MWAIKTNSSNTQQINTTVHCRKPQLICLPSHGLLNHTPRTHPSKCCVLSTAPLSFLLWVFRKERVVGFGAFVHWQWSTPTYLYPSLAFISPITHFHCPYPSYPTTLTSFLFFSPLLIVVDQSSRVESNRVEHSNVLHWFER